MSAVSPEVEKRLRVVQEQILAHPELYDQLEIMSRPHGTDRIESAIQHSCGTICCIAGWLYLNDVGFNEESVKASMKVDNEMLIEHASALIGEPTEKFQSMDDWPNLFQPMYEWPGYYQDAKEALEDDISNLIRYVGYTGDYFKALAKIREIALAQIASDRIDHFIETGE